MNQTPPSKPIAPKNPATIQPIVAIVGVLLFALLSPALASAQGLIFQQPRPQQLDNNGLIAAGYKLCTYQATTTTPLNTYSDAGLTTPNTNPLVANSAGRWTSSSTEVNVYLLKQAYKFVLLTAGTDGTCATGATIWTADNVPGGYDASVLIAGTVATARLGSGSATNQTFLRGDATWATAWTTVTTTATGAQNDFAPGLVGNTILRCNNGTALTINGFSGGFDGQRIVLISIGAGEVDLAHQAAGSTAANRLINYVTSGVTPLAAGVGTAEYEYDGTTQRWRLTQHTQGAYITRSFAAGNYTASAGTWTVASATRDAFYLEGQKLTFSEEVSGTTSTTPVTVKVTLPNSWTETGSEGSAFYISGNGSGSSVAGYWQTANGQNTLNLQQLGNATFGAGTVAVFAVAIFQIQ